MCVHRILTVVLVVTGLGGCASSRLLLEVEPATAEIKVVESPAAARMTNAGRLLGKGSVSLQKTEALRKLISISANGYEPLSVYIPDVGPDEQIKVILSKEDGRLAQEVASLRSDLEAERKTNALLKEQIVRQSGARHSVGLQLVQLQKLVGLSMLEDAETTASELFKQPEEFLPAAAFTLRGKLRIQQGRFQDAKADLQKAMTLSPSDGEARSLMESLK